MTTSQPSVSSLRPSRLCRYLACALLLKLCLLGSMALEPLWLALDTRPEPDRTVAAAPPATPQAAAIKPAATAAPATAGKYPLSPATAQAATPAAPAGQPAAQNAPAPTDLSKEALQRRQDEIARKEQDLRTLEKDLDSRIERLQALEARLQVMLKDAEEVKNAKFRHLIDVLSNMKAKQAAEVLETLDEKIAVKVLSGMRGRQAGEILTFVKPAKAARLSEALARIQLPFE